MKWKYSSAMEFIESERGNQKLNIKQKKNCGGQLSGGLLSCSPFICSVGEIVCILITINKLLDIFFFTFQHFFNTYFSKNCLVLSFKMFFWWYQHWSVLSVAYRGREMVLTIRFRFKVDHCFPIISFDGLVYYL